MFDALLGWLSRGTGPRHLAACGVPALAIAGSARTDYGVMQLDGAGAYQVQGYDERSETPVVVSIGIYVLDPSALAHILAGGSAYISDLGMCGPYDSVLGRRKDRVVKYMSTNMPQSFDVATGDVRLCGALAEIDTDTGRASSIERIEVQDENAEAAYDADDRAERPDRGGAGGD